MMNRISRIFSPTATSSNRPKVRVPRLRMNVISRQITIAGRFTRPPSSWSAVPCIHTGTCSPMPDMNSVK
jgi:hypothetical protein